MIKTHLGNSTYKRVCDRCKGIFDIDGTVTVIKGTTHYCKTCAGIIIAKHLKVK